MPLYITLICKEEEYEYPFLLSLRDLSCFFWDIALLHDRVLTFWLDPNNPILYSPNFYRRWRRLPPALDLKIGKISKYSPIEIDLIVVTAGGFIMAAKTFAELLRLIRDWSLEQEKKRLENLRTRIEILERLEGLRKASPEFLILLDKDIHKILGHPIRLLQVKEKRYDGSDFKEDENYI